MSDKEIIDLIMTDTPRGMRMLIDEYSPTVYAAVNSRLGGVCSYDDVEACVNRVFTEFYFNIKKFNAERCSIKTFLNVLARNKAIEEFRKNIRRLPELPGDLQELVEVPDSFDMEGDTERRMMEHKLLRAVDSLGLPDSRIIIRRYFYAQPSKQIARDMGMTDAAVRKHISRSLARLRVMLESSSDTL